MCMAWLDDYHKNYLANSLARPNWDHLQYPTRHVHRFNFYGEQRCRISTGNFRIINDKQGCKVNGFDWGESMKLVHVLTTLLNDYLMFSIKLWLNSLFRTNRVANEDTLIGATVWDVCIFSLARLIIMLVYSLFYLFLLFSLFACLCFLSNLTHFKSSVQNGGKCPYMLDICSAIWVQFRYTFIIMNKVLIHTLQNISAWHVYMNT